MEKVRILMVCLGNICRSPTAEGVLRHMAAAEAPQLNILVDSAGTAGYHIGEPPDERSQRAAKLRGVDLAGLRARQVVRQDFARFDLILAMDRNNLRDLQAMRPAGSPAKVQLFLDYARPRAGASPRAGAAQCAGTDIPDPYYGDAAGFEQVLDLTTIASRGLLAALQNGA